LVGKKVATVMLEEGELQGIKLESGLWLYFPFGAAASVLPPDDFFAATFDETLAELEEVPMEHQEYAGGGCGGGCDCDEDGCGKKKKK
jgi:hypothetical protein